MKALQFLITLLYCSGYLYAQEDYSKLEILKDYKLKGYLSDNYNYLLYKISDLNTAKTKFSGNIQINEEINDSGLNFFIIKEDPQEAFKEIECNCAYVGKNNVIICDEKLFKYLEGRLTVSSPQFESIATNTNARFYFFLCEWLIGHEIGHVLLGHDVGHFYTDINFLKTQKTDTSSVKKYFDKERDADFYVIRNMYVEDEQNPFWFWLGLSSMISTSYPDVLNEWQKYLQNRSYVPRQINLDYNLVQHPPWLKRYLDMVFLLLETYPKLIFDKSGYFEFLQKRIFMNLSDKNISAPFCDYALVMNDTTARTSKNTLPVEEYSWNYQRGIDLYYMTSFEDSKSEFDEVINKILKKKVRTKEDDDYLVGCYKYIGLIELVRYNLKGSFAALEKAMKVYETEEILNYLSVNYLEQGGFYSAQDYAKKCLRLNEFNAGGWLNLALSYSALNDEAKTKLALKYAYAIDPNILNLNQLKYLLYYPKLTLEKVKQLKLKYLDSLRLSFKNLDASSEYFEFIYRYSFSLYSHKYYEKSEEKCNQLITLLENKKTGQTDDSLMLADLYNFLGMIKNASNSKALARAKYNKSLEIKDKMPANIKTLHFLKGQTYYNIGNLFLETRVDSSLFYYKKATDEYNLDSNNLINYVVEKNKLLWKSGIIYLKQDKLEKALNIHLMALTAFLKASGNKEMILSGFLDFLENDLSLLLKQKNEKKLKQDKLVLIKKFQTSVRSLLNKHHITQPQVIADIDAYFKKILSN